MMFIDYVLTVLPLLMGGAIACIGIKPADNKFFTKDYTEVLKALSCLVVIYVHIHANYVNTLQDAIGSFSGIGVTLFFMISAYGMSLSADKKKDYLNSFWRNRLVSLLIPCLLVNLLGVCLTLANSGNPTLNSFVKINPYVKVLFEYLVWFYVIEVCKKHWFPNNKRLEDTLLIGGVVVSSLIYYFAIFAKGADNSAQAGWCFERIGLVWGLLIFRYFDAIVVWMRHKQVAKIIILTLISLIVGYTSIIFKTEYFWGEYLLKIARGFVLPLLLFIVTCRLQLGNKAILWLGSVSFEVYLCHGVVMYALDTYCPQISSGLYVFLTVCLSVVVAGILHSIGAPIVKKMRM